MVLKQHKEYRKKTSTEVIDSQNKIFDSSAGNLTTTVSGGSKVGTQLGQLDLDKIYGGDDIFVDMPPLEDALDHDRSSPKQNLSNILSDHDKVLESPCA